MMTYTTFTPQFPSQPGREAISWLGTTLTGAVAQRAWRQAVMDDPGAAIYLHPEIVTMPRTIRTDPPIVYARDGEGGGFGALAILEPRALHIPVLPRIHVSLRACRVVDSYVVGAHREDLLRKFMAEASELMKAQDFECILLEDLPIDSPLRSALRQYAPEYGMRVFEAAPPAPHWYIRFPDKPDDYWKQFSKKTRYNLRYRAKKLEHRLIRITEPLEVSSFLRKAADIFTRSWQHHRLGYGIRDDEQERALWSKVAGMGAFRSYLLEHQGRPVAYVHGVQWKGVYRYEHTGYDAALAPFSPGQVLLHRVLEDLISFNTPQVFDFGFGDMGYKEVFGNHRVMTGPLVMARPGFRPAAALTANRLRRQLATGSRAVLNRLGILSPLRRLYRITSWSNRKRPIEGEDNAGEDTVSGFSSASLLLPTLCSLVHSAF